MWRWLLRHSGEPVSRIPQPFFFSIRTSRYSQNMSIQLIFLMYFPNYVFPWSSYSSPFNWSVKHSLGMSTFSSGINLPCIQSKKKRKRKSTLNFSKWLPKTCAWIQCKTTSSSSFHTEPKKEVVVHSREAKVILLVQLQGMQSYKFSSYFTVSKQHFTHGAPGCVSSSPLVIPPNIWQVSPGHRLTSKGVAVLMSAGYSLVAFGLKRNKKLPLHAGLRSLRFRFSLSLSERSL